jgi:HD-like signal output (HDOD) protein
LIKHILFVDDDPMVLDGLRRALRVAREEWDMHFVSAGDAALEALEREPFDAIVTDMRMPMMDGAQLLDRVKESHPDVVRIVLSGQSSKESVMRSVLPAHQYLAKPCDLKELRARLSQAFAMRDLLRNQALATIVTRLRAIPSLPTLYNELSAALRDENTSLGQIEEIVSKDVSMAAKILQLANSAFIGAHGQVTSLRQALALIGAEVVRSLTLTIHVFSRFDRNSSVAQYLPALWNHSVSVASLAQRIAFSETRNKSMAEESFTTGLLHDIGKIVLFAEMPDKYSQVLKQVTPETRSVRDLELEFVGCPHELVGAYLMAIWGLPASTVQAVEFHHLPSSSPQREFSALTAVHCADAIVSNLDTSLLNHDVEMDHGHLQSLGLIEKEQSWRDLHNEALLAANASEASF